MEVTTVQENKFIGNTEVTDEDMETIAKFCKGRYNPLEICNAGCQRYFAEFIKSKRDSTHTTRRVILSSPPPAPQLSDASTMTSTPVLNVLMSVMVKRKVDNALTLPSSTNDQLALTLPSSTNDQLTPQEWALQPYRHHPHQNDWMKENKTNNPATPKPEYLTLPDTSNVKQTNLNYLMEYICFYQRRYYMACRIPASDVDITEKRPPYVERWQTTNKQFAKYQ